MMQAAMITTMAFADGSDGLHFSLRGLMVASRATYMHRPSDTHNTPKHFDACGDLVLLLRLLLLLLLSNAN